MLAAVVLSGCSAIARPGAYDRVDTAVAELDLDSFGEVVVEGHYGGTFAPGEPPTYAAVIEGDDAATELAAELPRAGFVLGIAEDDGAVWSRGKGDSKFTLAYREVAPGEEVDIGGNDWTVQNAGIVVRVRGVL